MIKQQELFMGIDVGFGTVVASTALSGGDVKHIAIPSHSCVTQWKDANFSGLNVADRPIMVSYGDKVYAVGGNAHGWGDVGRGSMLYDHLGDASYKVIVLAAISEAIGGGGFCGKVNVALAVPNEMVLSPNPDDVKRAKKMLKEAYNGRHEWTCDGSQYDIDMNVLVIAPQAICAMTSLDIDDMDYSQSIAIVTVGANTVETVVVRDGSLLPHGAAGNRRVGVRSLATMAYGRDVRWAMADQRIRRKDIEASVIDEWATGVANAIDDSIDGTPVSYIVLCGGGTLISAKRSRNNAGSLVASKLHTKAQCLMHGMPTECVSHGAYIAVSGGW